DEHSDLRDAVRDEDPAAEAGAAIEVEHLGVSEGLREPDRRKADRDEDNAEERIHRAQIRPLRAGIDGEPEHEVRAVEEVEDEEEHELVLAPEPPVSPRDLGPDRTGQEHERPEDQPLVDADVALEIGARIALPKMPQRLPGTAG